MRRIEQAQTTFEVFCIGTDFAGEKVILTKQQVIVVVIKSHGHPVVREHQESERSRVNFLFRHHMAHECLEKRLVGDPRCAEETDHVTALFGEIENLLDGLTAQTPPLAADLHLNIRRDFTFEAKPFLEVEHRIKQLFLRTLIEPVTIDQPLFCPACFDPVALEVIKALDEVAIVIVQIAVGIFC